MFGSGGQSPSAPLRAATLSVVRRPTHSFRGSGTTHLRSQVLECGLTHALVWLQDMHTIVTYVTTLDSPALSLVVSSLNLLKLVWPVHDNWAPIHSGQSNVALVSLPESGSLGACGMHSASTTARQDLW